MALLQVVKLKIACLNEVRLHDKTENVDFRQQKVGSLVLRLRIKQNFLCHGAAAVPDQVSISGWKRSLWWVGSEVEAAAAPFSLRPFYCRDARRNARVLGFWNTSSCTAHAISGPPCLEAMQNAKCLWPPLWEKVKVEGGWRRKLRKHPQVSRRDSFKHIFTIFKWHYFDMMWCFHAFLSKSHLDVTYKHVLPLKSAEAIWGKVTSAAFTGHICDCSIRTPDPLLQVQV